MASVREVLLVEMRFVDLFGGTLYRMREEGKGGEGVNVIK